MNDEPTAIPSGEVNCEPAQFDSVTDCGTVVVFNQTSETVMVKCVSSNPAEFVVDWPGSIQTGGAVRHCKDFDWQLKPGEHCFEPISFWPTTGEAKQATIRVDAEGPGITATATITVKGTSDYPPDLAAAEKVRERYEPELKKIPGVVAVELDKGDTIKMNIGADDEKQIPAIRRKVPSQLEGYETEVTRYSSWSHDYAL